MEFIKEWTFSICLSLLAAVVLSIFTPKGSLKRFYKILLSFFIVVSFLYPLKDFDFDIVDFNTLNSSILTKIEDTRETSMTNSINTQVKSVLESKGIKDASVNSNISMMNDEITINSVQVAVHDEYDLEAVEEVIFDEIGIKAKVIYIGQ